MTEDIAIISKKTNIPADEIVFINYDIWKDATYKSVGRHPSDFDLLSSERSWGLKYLDINDKAFMDLKKQYAGMFFQIIDEKKWLIAKLKCGF
jgi:hypothetical protein